MPSFTLTTDHSSPAPLPGAVVSRFRASEDFEQAFRRTDHAHEAFLARPVGAPLDTYESFALPSKGGLYSLAPGKPNKALLAMVRDHLVIAARIIPWIHVLVAPRIAIADRRISVLKTHPNGRWVEVDGAYISKGRTATVLLSSQQTPEKGLASLYRQLWKAYEATVGDEYLAQITASLTGRAMPSIEDLAETAPEARAEAFVIFALAVSRGIVPDMDSMAAAEFEDVFNGTVGEALDRIR